MPLHLHIYLLGLGALERCSFLIVCHLNFNLLRECVLKNLWILDPCVVRSEWGMWDQRINAYRAHILQ